MAAVAGDRGPAACAGPPQRLPWRGSLSRAAEIESRPLRPDTSDAKRRRRLPRLLSAALASSVLVSLVLAPSAWANLLTPKAGGSPNADQIHSLYNIILYIAAVVFVGVEGALIYSLYRFRAKKVRVAAQIHGNTSLEIGWTVGAALILVVLTVVTFVKLPSIINPPNSTAPFLESALTQPSPPNGKNLTICVQGRQYIWRYVYGAACESNPFGAGLPYSYQEMYVPVGVTVVLSITAVDVIHSWWIPSLGGKVDAVPGYTTYTWFKARGPALYHGQCAQLCGRQHAFMTALVNAMSPSDYQKTIAQLKQDIHTANSQVTVLRAYLTKTGNL
ncbi:MAG: cytochrome c oxidase subunit II [Solirubrobacterales bacterium]|nr:cytochrome c oxidase subunit II [Solirubrobacterales bacterium]